MTTTAQNATANKTPSPSPYAQYGIPLSRATLRALEKRGIYCQTSVSVEHQHLAKRYVLRGIESGGGVSDLGRYCAYLGIDGSPLPSLRSVDSISGNGRHAVVVAPELVRIEMLRIGRTYELAITQHSLQTPGGAARPKAASKLLFRGREGTLTIDLWSQENRSLRGKMIPCFYSDAGEARTIPVIFESAVKSVTEGLNCLACKHVHIATSRRPQSKENVR